MFKTTWLNSPGNTGTGGSTASKFVTSSAMYFHSLRQTVSVKLNLELAAASEIVEIACRVKPAQATLVPERREERTTEGGLDLLGDALPAVRSAILQLGKAGIPVSLFIAPDPAQLRAAAQLKVPRIELHTGSYCEATLHHGGQLERDRRAAGELERLAQAAIHVQPR